MNNIITLLVVVLIVIATFIYLEREAKRRDKAEKERFREFVIAAKSKNLEDYSYNTPSEGELPQEEEADELMDLKDVPPEVLLKAIKGK